MSFFTKELRDRLEAKRAMSGLSDEEKAELAAEAERKRQQEQLVRLQSRPQDKLVGGRTRALARVHLMELLEQQDKRTGAFPLDKTLQVTRLTLDALQRVGDIAGERLQPDALSTLAALAFVEAVLDAFEALAPATTVVRQQLGAKETLELEVVQENPVTVIRAEMQRKQLADWRARAEAFLQAACPRLVAQLPLVVRRVRDELLFKTAAADVDPVARRFTAPSSSSSSSSTTATTTTPTITAASSSGGRRTVQFRSKFITLAKAWDPFSDSKKPLAAFTEGSVLPLDTHFVERAAAGRTLQELHWCGDADCGTPHRAVLGRPLGRGQFSVFLAAWNGQAAAAKLFPRSGDVQAAYLNELHMMSKIGSSHPNVVGLLAASITPPLYHFVMRYMGGGCLYDLLHHPAKRRPGWPAAPYPLPTLLRLLYGVAAGLHYLHSDCGIVHRDVKSLNVLVGNDGAVALCDFGVSAFMTRAESAVADVQVGTPVYMAPEIVRRRRYTHTADTYSFAVLAVEVLSATEPFADDVAQLGWQRVIQLVASEGKRPPIPDHCHPDLRALIQELFADDTNRPTSDVVLRRLFDLATRLDVDLKAPPFPTTPLPPLPQPAEALPPAKPPSDLEIIPITTSDKIGSSKPIENISTIVSSSKPVENISSPSSKLVKAISSTSEKVVSSNKAVASEQRLCANCNSPIVSTPSPPKFCRSCGASLTADVPFTASPSRPGPPPPLPEDPSETTIALLLEERARLAERGLARLDYVQPVAEEEQEDSDSSSEPDAESDDDDDDDDDGSQLDSISVSDIQRQLADFESLSGAAKSEQLSARLGELQRSLERLSARRAVERQRSERRARRVRERFERAEAQLEDLCEQLASRIDGVQQEHDIDAHLAALDQIEAAYDYLESARGGGSLVAESDGEKIARLERENAQLRSYLDVVLKENHLLKERQR